MAAGRDKDRCWRRRWLRGTRRISHGNRRISHPPIGDTTRTEGLLLPIKLTALRLRPSIGRLGVHTTGIISPITDETSIRKQREDSRVQVIMLTFQLTHAIILLAAIFLIDKCHAHPAIAQRYQAISLCRGCGDQCDQCEYGTIISTLCGVKECLKGPGERCGGPSEIEGVCGEGMMCNHCNKCIGCSSINFKCKTDDYCLPHLITDQDTRSIRYPDFFNRFSIDK